MYAKRDLLWEESDVYDCLRIPDRPLIATETPFRFLPNLDEERIRARFEAVCGADDFDESLEKAHAHAFIVIRDDVILYEECFNGGSRESIVPSLPTAKSFASALIGVAISEEYIHSVEGPIIEYLPKLAESDPAFAKITIRDQSMMSSGSRYVGFAPTGMM